jgi:hypothetical protein
MMINYEPYKNDWYQKLAGFSNIVDALTNMADYTHYK